MGIRVTDNTKAASDAILEAASEALAEVGEAAKAYARQNVHVVTGNLRDSIDYQVDGNRVTIYAGMPYAPYEELGTSRQPSHPYLRPAVMDHTSEFVETVAKRVRDAL